VNEHGALSVHLATHISICSRKRVEAVLDIAVSRRSVFGQGNTTIAHAERRKILNVACGTVVDGENGANSAAA
jgi:hypothetical protein